jgi:hypothetical protein
MLKFRGVLVYCSAVLWLHSMVGGTAYQYSCGTTLHAACPVYPGTIREEASRWWVHLHTWQHRVATPLWWRGATLQRNNSYIECSSCLGSVIRKVAESTSSVAFGTCPMCFQGIVNPLKPEIYLNNIQRTSVPASQKTPWVHYKDNSVNAVQESNCHLFWESYKTHKCNGGKCRVC